MEGGCCSSGQRQDRNKEMELSDINCKSLLANDDNAEFSPSLPRTPNMNGTDFTKHKVPDIVRATRSTLM